MLFNGSGLHAEHLKELLLESRSGTIPTASTLEDLVEEQRAKQAQMVTTTFI